jgi:hypothetical protein
MVIFESTAGKRKRRRGLFDGKPFRNLARFMVFVGPIVYTAMLLVLRVNALAFQDIIWKTIPIGLKVVNRDLISLATKIYESGFL